MVQGRGQHNAAEEMMTMTLHTRQMIIDAHRRCQPIEELARKAIKAKRYGALAGTMTMEEYDFAFVRVCTTWAELGANGEGEKR